MVQNQRVTWERSPEHWEAEGKKRRRKNWWWRNISIQNNWENEEVLRQYFINRYPKYGNDVDEVDLLGSELLSFYGDDTVKVYIDGKLDSSQPLNL